MPPVGAIVQEARSWLMLGGLRELGFYELADQRRGEAMAMASLRPATGKEPALVTFLALGVAAFRSPVAPSGLPPRGSSEWGPERSPHR